MEERAILGSSEEEDAGEKREVRVQSRPEEDFTSLAPPSIPPTWPRSKESIAVVGSADALLGGSGRGREAARCSLEH